MIYDTCLYLFVGMVYAVAYLIHYFWFLFGVLMIFIGAILALLAGVRARNPV
jgi:hypothetical protein